MPSHGQLKDRLTNKFNRLLHFLSPGRSRWPSPPIRPTLDPTTMSLEPSSIHGIPDTQFLNSSSLSNIYPSIVINSAGDELHEAPGGMTSTGFQGIKTTLRLIERATDVFPPLKSTVGGLLGVIDIVEVCHFQLNVVIGISDVDIMLLIVSRQPLKINKIAKIWSRS